MILCCGEALIDMLPRQTTEGQDAYLPLAGGAIFNTAIALGRLGEEAGLLTGLSNDLFGQQLNQVLQDSCVSTRFAIATDRPTTLAFVKLENGQASYSFYDENSAGRMIQPADIPPLDDKVDALYFGGISLAVEPGADTLSGLLQQEKSNRTIILDPNIRPGFISDEARYRARMDQNLAAADIVKISDEDLDWMIPGDDSHDSKVQQILARGPSLVVLTKGSDGAIAFLQNGDRVSVAANRVQVVDTVGAGDTFNAGMMASLKQQDLLCKDRLAALSATAMEDALQFGNKVAAVTVSRAGANPPWANELD